MKKTKKTSQARLNKNKGKAGQNEVRDILLGEFPELDQDDVVSNPMGNPGEDIMLSPYARQRIPWNIEVKRKRRIAAVDFLDQARAHGNFQPVAVFREDYQKEWYAMVEFKYLLELLHGKESSDASGSGDDD